MQRTASRTLVAALGTTLLIGSMALPASTQAAEPDDLGSRRAAAPAYVLASTPTPVGWLHVDGTSGRVIVGGAADLRQLGSTIEPMDAPLTTFTLDGEPARTIAERAGQVWLADGTLYTATDGGAGAVRVTSQNVRRGQPSELAMVTGPTLGEPIALIGTQLFYLDGSELVRIDLGADLPTAFDLGVDLHGPLVAAGGSRLVVGSGAGFRVVQDVLGTPTTSVVFGNGDELIHLADDGSTISTSDGTEIRRWSANAPSEPLAVVAGAAVAPGANGSSWAVDTGAGAPTDVYLDGLAAPIESYPDETSRELRAMAMGQQALYRIVQGSGGARLQVFDLTPVITETDPELYRPASSSTFTAKGYGLQSVVDAAIDGISTDYQRQGVDLVIDTIAGDVGATADVTLRNVFGEGAAFAMPIDLPTGTALVTISAELAGPGHGRAKVRLRCRPEAPFDGGVTASQRARKPQPLARIVPARSTCVADLLGAPDRAVVTFSGADGVRRARAGSTVTFLAAGTTDIVFVSDATADATRPLWLELDPYGGGRSASIRTRLTCGDDEQRVTLRAARPKQVDLPRDSGACTLGITNAGAADATRVLADGQLARGGRLPAGTAEVTVEADYGGADPRTVTVSGVPGQRVDGRAQAGAVVTLPLDFGGDPFFGDSELLSAAGNSSRQAVAGAHLGAATAIGDFDDDGWPDIAAGAPDAGAGSVTIFYGSPSGHRGGESKLLKGETAGDRFGAALAVVDANGDGIDDLAVGAPRAAAPGEARGGTVAIHLGGRRKITQAPGAIHDAGAPAGTDFGAALAGDGGWLIIGAPGADDARGSATVVHLPTSSFRILRAEDRQPGARLGAAVAIDGVRIAAGAPGTDVQGRADAGAVTVARLTASGIGSVRTITQAGLTDTGGPEAGDRFGAAVALAKELVVGAPGEATGGGPAAGAITMINLNSQLAPVDSATLNQDDNLVGDFTEEGDEFGATVVFNRFGQLLVGAPGEDVGPFDDGGAIHWFLNGEAPAHVQGTDLPGTLGDNNRVGTSAAG